MKKKPEILSPIPEPTDQSNNDMEFSTEMNRWFLQPIGIWPVKPNANFIQKCFPSALLALCCLLMCFLFIPYILHMFVTVKNLKVRVRLIGPMSFSLMVMSKYGFLVVRRNKIRDCLNHINVDWRRAQRIADREIMINHAKLGRFITSLSAFFMYGGGFFYHTVIPLSHGKIMTANNVSIRPLPYPVYSGFFTAERSPYYEIVFVAQWFSDFVRYSISVAVCSLGAIFVLHACGQLQIVMSRLESFIDDGDSELQIKYKIAEIVELHLRSIRLIVQIEEILNEMCLVELLGCTMNMCFLGYYILVELEKEHSRHIDILTYSVLFTSFTFNIFIFCYIGEMLTQQGKKVGVTAYMIDWYKLPDKDAKTLILVLEMSNYQSSITAGKMTELSYNSFFGVLKTALGYLNLMRTLIL